MGWAWLGSARLGWAGLDCARLGSAGLGWNQLVWAGLGWARLAKKIRINRPYLGRFGPYKPQVVKFDL